MDVGSAEVDGPADVRPPLVLGRGVPHHAGPASKAAAEFGTIPLTIRKPGVCSAARPHPAAPGTGWTGAAATRPGHAGSTSEHGWPGRGACRWAGPVGRPFL